MRLKNALCVLFAAQAVTCSAATPCEACTRQINSTFGSNAVCVPLSDDDEAPTVPADKRADNDKKPSDKKTEVSEHKGGWQIYACIGGGVLVIMVIVGILAGAKKK